MIMDLLSDSPKVLALIFSSAQTIWIDLPGTEHDIMVISTEEDTILPFSTSYSTINVKKYSKTAHISLQSKRPDKRIQLQSQTYVNIRFIQSFVGSGIVYAEHTRFWGVQYDLDAEWTAHVHFYDGKRSKTGQGT